MTVNNTNVTAGPYIGNNTSSVFSYEFKILDSDELNVYETDDNGVETLLTLDTDYTVQDVGEAVGTVTRSAGNLPTGYTWFIVSNYDELQETSFSSQGAFFPKIHERAFDKLTKLVQQTAYNVSNAFKNLNMRGFKIINLKDAVDPQDAATFGQVTILNDEAAASASASANSATASANSASASANSATASADSATDAQTAEDGSEAAALASATSLATFQDQYWGSYASEPALSPVGNPATSGDLYFNETLNKLLVFNGTIWQVASSAVTGIRNRYVYEAVSGVTTFDAVYDIGFVDVLINGVVLTPTQYTAINGTTITLNDAVTNDNDVVMIIALGSVEFSDLGTMALVDKQSSPTDATAGRGLLVRAFGLGVDAADTGNWLTLDADTYKVSGQYLSSNSSTNIPSGAGFGTLVVYASSDPTFFTQDYVAVQSQKRWARTKLGASWSDWQPVYTGASYQPETVQGIGVRVRMKNVLGSPATPNLSLGGSNVRYVYTDAAGNEQVHNIVPTGTYKYVGPTNLEDDGVSDEFVRTI